MREAALPSSVTPFFAPGAAHEITVAGGCRPCLTSSLCNQRSMPCAVAVVLRFALSTRPSLQSRRRSFAAACKCLKAEDFSGLTRPSLQPPLASDTSCAADRGCAPHRPGAPRDTVASSRCGVDSRPLGIAPGSRDSRGQLVSAVVATGGGVRVDTQQRSNNVGEEFVGGVERGCRMLRTADESDSLLAPGKVAARGWQGNWRWGRSTRNEKLAHELSTFPPSTIRNRLALMYAHTSMKQCPARSILPRVRSRAASNQGVAGWRWGVSQLIDF